MYIGIIGFKGNDKHKIAQLYGQTFDWILTHKDIDKEPDFEYIKEYIKWCDALAEGEKLINNNVYYASFSHPLKMIVSMITGIPFNIINDRKLKNEYIINIKTLQYKYNDGEKLITPEKLFRKRNRNLSMEYDDKQELPDAWMTLNDYIIYFGYYLCRNYIGKDIWTNVERVSNSKLPMSSTIRIYTDIRSISEYNYIKEKNGIVIRLNQSKESDCVVYDKELFSVDSDIEMGWFNNIRGLYDEIYKNCYKIIQDAEL